MISARFTYVFGGKFTTTSCFGGRDAGQSKRCLGWRESQLSTDSCCFPDCLPLQNLLTLRCFISSVLCALWLASGSLGIATNFRDVPYPAGWSPGKKQFYLGVLTLALICFADTFSKVENFPEYLPNQDGVMAGHHEGKDDPINQGLFGKTSRKGEA